MGQLVIKNIEIIICTESGYLEPLSKLLAYSLRNFGGKLSHIPIYSYKPRRGPSLAKDTIKFFEQNQVEFIDLVLNKKYADKPYANKLVACNHREKNTNADILIFLDSDTFFLAQPDEFLNMGATDALLRPAGFNNVGTPKSFANDDGEHWKKLYGLLNVRRIREVTTTIDNQKILEYYNSGVIVTNTKNDLFKHWKDNYEKAVEMKLIPRRSVFLDQTVLSATVAQLELNVKHLGKYYNCPIHRIANSQNELYKLNDFENVVLVHYHKIFKNSNASNPIFDQLNYFKNGRIINQRLAEFNVLCKENESLKMRIVKNLKNLGRRLNSRP
jgi:hypothetical protein